jgi:hypothetical protein
MYQVETNRLVPLLTPLFLAGQYLEVHFDDHTKFEDNER